MTALVMEAEWPAPRHVRACVSLRAGGISCDAYASLNLADHVGDEDAAVAENRRRLVESLRLPAEPAWLEQVHATRVVDLDAPWSGPADAATTRRVGTVCAVLTADCLPVLFSDCRGKRVAAAHAGWRGLASGVLKHTVAAMQCAPSDLLVWLGPAIAQAAYEVGDEVRAAFVALNDASASAFQQNARGRWQANLYELARLELAGLGVDAIYGGGLCTWTDAARFFSHRRQAPCGRMASLIWMDA